MWTDILNHPEEGMKFCRYRPYLMNVPVDYNDEIERNKTHQLHLPREKYNKWRKYDFLLSNKHSPQECVGKNGT